jgi:hypothetical protein
MHAGQTLFGPAEIGPNLSSITGRKVSSAIFLAAGPMTS